LEELLPAHVIVKVQLNGNPSRAEEEGQRLAVLANACLLEVRGSHMLFTSGEYEDSICFIIFKLPILY
jgi:RNA-binding protein YhbY